jgi:hypothetical protein
MTGSLASTGARLEMLSVDCTGMAQLGGVRPLV